MSVKITVEYTTGKEETKHMNKLYVLVGVSGAGKDTTAEIIQRQLYATVNVKFSQPMKDAFEQWLGLERGFLNTDKRNLYVLNQVTGERENFTYHDLMIRAWKSWREIYPSLTVGYVYRNCLTELTYSKNVSLIFSDVRNKEEMQAVRLLKEKTNTPICFIILEGRGDAKESDAYCNTLKNYESFMGERYVIDNPGTINELEQAVIAIL